MNFVTKNYAYDEKSKYLIKCTAQISKSILINNNTLCSQFMRFRFMRFSIYAVLGNGPYSCFMQQFSHIMRFLVKIIVHKILVIFILHLCYSCIMRFFLGNKKRVNGELSVQF